MHQDTMLCLYVLAQLTISTACDAGVKNSAIYVRKMKLRERTHPRSRNNWSSYDSTQTYLPQSLPSHSITLLRYVVQGQGGEGVRKRELS